jgi:hypothetical protein
MKKTSLLLVLILAAVLGAQSSYAQSAELVRVYRWYNTEDRNYVTVAEGEFQEGQMLNWKWRDKTQIFVAYRNPGPDRVAVYAWFNPLTKDRISVAEDEYTDDNMLKMGYTQKRLQFYAPIRRGPNNIAVYRWLRGANDWVSIPEEGNTDAYIKKGFRRKTFQYYGIMRSTDVQIYDQL